MSQLQIGEFKFQSHNISLVYVYRKGEYLELFDTGGICTDEEFAHICEQWVKRTLRVHELLCTMFTDKELTNEGVCDIEKAWLELGKQFGNLAPSYQSEIQKDVGFDISKDGGITDTQFILICKYVDKFNEVIGQVATAIKAKVTIEPNKAEELFKSTKERLTAKDSFCWFFKGYRLSMGKSRRII